MKTISYTILVELLQKHSLKLYAISDDISELFGAKERLKKWQEAGFAEKISYMQRSPDLLADPKQLLAGVRTIMAFAIPYAAQRSTEFKKGYGRVARYAFGKDYHKVLKKRLTNFVNELKEKVGNFNYRFASDAIPLLERALAERLGIGVVGFNSVLRTKLYGSFFFLAELLFDFVVEDIPSEIKDVNAMPCGQCTRCIKQCPAGAIVDKYTIDASRCISYLTIENRGILSVSERETIGAWIFGCDACQSCCPYNFPIMKKFHEKEIFPEFLPDHGCGEWISLSSVLMLKNQDEFVARFAGTPIIRGKRDGLVRNAVIVAANTECVELFDQIYSVFKSDSSEIVRIHSLWALYKLAFLMGGREVNLVKDLIMYAKNCSDEKDLQKEALSFADIL